MPFGFPRRSSDQFKHIAHGLVPAATVAPRSAVPRTPPPRSPNPSPERPRSALAAAILMASLTGRTVAMPHPRLRSYSESDASGTQDESFIQPYATASDFGHSWRTPSPCNNRSPSPDLSDEDIATENVVANLSYSEKKSSNHVLEQTDLTLSTIPIYASPNKGLKLHRIQNTESPPPLPDRPCMESEMSPVSSRSEAHDVEISSLKVDCEITAHHAPQSMKLNDMTDTTRQPSIAHSKEQIEALTSENQHLTAENNSLTIRLKELKKQVKGLRLALNEMGDENQKLKQEVNKPGQDEVVELLSLQQQAQELVDENYALKMTVHHLNVELSRYQTKFRPLSQEESVRNASLPMRGPPPPWLLDMKYLSPLMLAYEDRMRERDLVIQAHEEEMRCFRARVEEVVQENEHLHEKLEKNRPTTSKEWRQLQEQAKLVLDENQNLMKQFEVQQAKAKESHSRHIQEVSKLSKQLMLLETKRENQEQELSEMQKQLQASRSKCDELKANLDGKIAAEEHVAMVNELKSHLREEQEKRQVEVDDLMRRLSVLQAEKKSLMLEKNTLTADNRILEEELEMTQKNHRKSHKKIAVLKQHLDEAMEKEVAAHQYLANLIHLTENITMERDQLLRMAKNLETEKHNFLNKVLGGHVRLGRLEEKVKVYKKKAALKVEDISHRLHEQEEDFAGQAARYQREMKHLQRMLLDRQETLDQVLQQKRDVEGELEIVWESTSIENQRMKALLTKSLENNKWDSSKPDAFDSDESPQKDSVYGIALRDWDAKLSSPRED
ncbi:centrosomal protein of 89 kDa isoform X2 [Ambystoma mexicanum]|uniref:centrosomal protein of 89 kDa isoform X2 n=1 Tax=Ambystoma mexicanum TaxID=8296 RepID=UPI0037E8CD7C